MQVSGNDIEQNANTYNLDACNKLAKPNLSNLAWLYLSTI